MKHKAFTLIEMLIVVVIIGILASALIPRLQSIQAKARDTKRKTDLRTIYTANEIYLSDVGKYVPAIGCPYNSNCYSRSTDAQPWLNGLAGIINNLPIDPINIGSYPWTPGEYVYAYGNVFDKSGGKNTYDLTTQLESKTDPDRCAIRQYNFYYNPLVARCGSYSSQLYEFSPDSNSF